MLDPAQPKERNRGFVLVLVVDERQTEGHESIARVYREYDPPTPEGLEDQIRTACQQAGNQLALRRAALAVVARSSVVGLT